MTRSTTAIRVIRVSPAGASMWNNEKLMVLFTIFLVGYGTSFEKCLGCS